MADNQHIIQPLSQGIKEIDIAGEVRSSFLDYAMSVIVARAIPDVRDGLKPVHRRIIYSMSEQGMYYNKPYKKCARIVGDVIGKYHPHGDSSVYDALVRLAQDFSSRYPLIDGHGNFGSVDGDPPAAFRYTESRMARLTGELVLDINKDTVEFVPNYDGEENEPVVLPARFPNLLVNGTTGIAVGMATNIPPHNMAEVIDATLALIEDPDIDIIELLENHLPAPDFPTGGLIMGRSGIRKAYQTGNGSFIIRSRATIEEVDGRKRIVVTEIPYAVNKANLVKKISDLARDKVVDGITDIRDESSQRVGIRIVIDVRKDIVPEVLLNHLFKLTALQTSFSINMLALDKGQPKILNLKEVLNKYIEHQVDVITRRSKFELEKARDREHVLEGLKIVGDFPDEVYQIVKSSETPDLAQERLIARFSLSERQARVILDMQFRRLTMIEKNKIEDELAALRETISRLVDILSNNRLVLEIITQDLKDIKARYGDPRRSEISNADFDITDEALIPQEDIVVSLTANGYIKRVSVDTYRLQRRGGQGVKGVSTYADDEVERLITLNTHTDLLFFTDRGRVFKLRGYQVPEFTRTAKGLPVINLLRMNKDEKVCSLISISSIEESATLLSVTKNGIVKRTPLSEYANINKNGKIAFALREGDELLDVKLTDGQSDIILATSDGRVACFPETLAREVGRKAYGVKGIDVGDGQVIGAAISLEGDKVFVISEHGYGKCSPLSDYRRTGRGAKGVKSMNVTEKTGRMVGIKVVNGSEELLITTTSGVVIRLSLANVPTVGRVTQGVRMIRMKGSQTVKSMTVFTGGDQEATEEAVPDVEDTDDGVVDDAE